MQIIRFIELVLVEEATGPQRYLPMFVGLVKFHEHNEPQLYTTIATKLTMYERICKIVQYILIKSHERKPRIERH